jgi:hypothetical protein
MKSRRLTETDLANMAFEPASVKRLRISSIIKPKRIIGSYEPFRTKAGDAVNEQFPFLSDDHAPTPIETLEKVIEKACRGDAELLKMNLEVARATYSYASEVGLTAERVAVAPLTLAFGHAYQFGLPLIMRFNGTAAAVFADLRRTSPLSAKGCIFILSMMHQRYRVNYPDLSELQLQIWRYQNNTERTVRPIISSDMGLIGYEDLRDDVAESYSILHQLMQEQLGDRRDDRDAGPLFSFG